MLKFAFGFFIAMIISFVFTGLYLGYYKSVDVRIEKPLDLHLMGLKVTGPYHMVNEHIEKVEAFAKKEGLDCFRSFGMYFDNPEKIEPTKLTSFVGCVTSREPENISSSKEGFSYQKFSTEKAYLARFEGSPALGPLKVYPEAKDWFEKNNLNWSYSLEIYSMKDGDFQTDYIFPIPGDEVNLDKLRL